jgi:adenylosuccinate lyase
VLDPRRHIGRAPQQVEAFVGDVIEPIRQRYAGEIGRAAELKV